MAQSGTGYPPIWNSRDPRPAGIRAARSGGGGVFQFESPARHYRLPGRMRCDRFDDMVATSAAPPARSTRDALSVHQTASSAGSRALSHPALEQILQPPRVLTYGAGDAHRHSGSRLHSPKADVGARRGAKRTRSLSSRSGLVRERASPWGTTGGASRISRPRSRPVAATDSTSRTPSQLRYGPTRRVAQGALRAEFHVGPVVLRARQHDNVVRYSRGARARPRSAPPDVNESGFSSRWSATTGFRFGLARSRTSARARSSPFAEATAGGPYHSRVDLCARSTALQIKRVLEALIDAGADDRSGDTRPAGWRVGRVRRGPGMPAGAAWWPAPHVWRQSLSRLPAPPLHECPPGPSTTASVRERGAGSYLRNTLARYRVEVELFRDPTRPDPGPMERPAVRVAAVDAVTRTISRRRRRIQRASRRDHGTAAAWSFQRLGQAERRVRIDAPCARGRYRGRDGTEGKPRSSSRPRRRSTR